MTDQAGLERGYRRLLAWYPRAFRRENEEEIIAVLLSTAPGGQQRPGLAESADLIRGGLRMRFGAPGSPRSVRAAVRLMYLGAAAELATLITIVVTVAAVRAAAGPVHWHAALLHIREDEIAAPIAIGVWLWLARMNSKGKDWARFAFMAFFGLITVGLLGALANGAVTYAPADLIAGAVLWLTGLVTMVFLFSPQSGRYFEYATAHRQPARR